MLITDIYGFAAFVQELLVHSVKKERIFLFIAKAAHALRALAGFLIVREQLAAVSALACALAPSTVRYPGFGEKSVCSHALMPLLTSIVAVSGPSVT